MTMRRFLSLSLVATLIASAAAAEEAAKPGRDAFADKLVELLVQRGILKGGEAQELMELAREQAAVEGAQVAPEPSAAPAHSAGKGAAADRDEPAGTMHISYVPDFVREQIRNEVRAELKADVVKQVKEDARKESWGIPAALPGWVSRIHPYFDLRLRLQDDFYGSANTDQSYYDWLQINQAGGFTEAQNRNRAFLNTTQDRLRTRERFRVGFDADLAEGLTAGFRLSTTNDFNPVSSNQSLGNTGRSWEVAIDRAFLQYDYRDRNQRDWFSLYAGRFASPFVSTETVFHPDLSFEGLAGTLRWRFHQDSPRVKNYHAAPATARFGVNLGPQTPDSLFATVGVFPIEEVNFSTSDKWLLGGQAGADWLVAQEFRVKLAGAYYDYRNVQARANRPDSFRYDWTAPQFQQKGNSLVPINLYAPDNTRCSDPFGPLGGCLYGLASDFRIFNATVALDYGSFDGNHLMLTLDYAKNLGFDGNSIARRFPGGTQYGDLREQTSAYQVRLDVGHPEMRRFNDWSAFLAYRYVERDAVLDAFTDSVLHGGGTDAKGWILGIQYGLAKNTWANLRWFSADAISGKPLAVDTAVVDLNARF